MAHLGPQLAAKAGGRRARVAIFGGSKNKKVGRRGRAGSVFNRKGSQFAQAAQRKRDAAAAALIVPGRVDTGDDFRDQEDD